MPDDDTTPPPVDPLTMDELNELLEKGPRLRPLDLEPPPLSLPPLAPGWEERVEATVKDHAEHLRADPSWRPPRPRLELEGPVPDSPTYPAEERPPGPRFKTVMLDRFGQPPPPPRPPTESPKARERRIRAERDAPPAPAPVDTGPEDLLREFVGIVAELGSHRCRDGQIDLEWDQGYGEVLALAIDIRWALWGEWDGDGPPDVGDAARRVRPTP